MPIEHALWTVTDQPAEVPQGQLPSEQMLEDMIVAQPRILSSEWMLIGRQVDTGSRAAASTSSRSRPDGTLVLVELKRDRTPREVVAQALDYASWVESLDAEYIAAIYGRFIAQPEPRHRLPHAFRAATGRGHDQREPSGGDRRRDAGREQRAYR